MRGAWKLQCSPTAFHGTERKISFHQHINHRLQQTRPIQQQSATLKLFSSEGKKIAADDLWIDSILSAIFVKAKQFRSLRWHRRENPTWRGFRILPTHNDSAETREKKTQKVFCRRGSLRFAISFLSPSSRGFCVCLCHRREMWSKRT